ncbi:putative RNA polymerase II subunit B1 CTD phosphatase RPAP2-like protein [Drosera capensis]
MGGGSIKVEEVISVSDAVQKLRRHLLEGILDENQLSSAGSLMSRSDYEDNVVGRSIAKSCGYPLCHNSVAKDELGKVWFRTALKEHKDNNVRETALYGSMDCAINSGTFVESLQNERCSTLDSAKLREIMLLIEDTSLKCGVELGNDGDLGLISWRFKRRQMLKVAKRRLQTRFAHQMLLKPLRLGKIKVLSNRKTKVMVARGVEAAAWYYGLHLNWMPTRM